MSRRPVVAMVTDAVHPFNHGGKEQRYAEVTRRLSHDCDVRVFTMKWWVGDRVLHIDDVEYVAICPKTALYSGARRSLFEASIFGLACLKLMVTQFDALEADHIPFAPLFALRAVCTVRRKRLVVTWHEVWGKELWQDYLGPKLGYLAWWVERGSMLMPDHIVAASSQTADRLRPYVRRGTRIDVAPNGLDLELIRRVEPVAKRTDLVFVGRLLAHKHVDLLLEAMALLAKEGHRLTCRVIGQGPELDRLREQARDLQIECEVEFLDDVEDQATVYALLKAADIFVFPSVREGFGMSVLEAIACGLPVVTTCAPDNHSSALVERTGRGIVCEPTGPDVARAIQRLRCLVPARGELADRECELQAVLRQYDWDAVADIVASALGVPRG